MHVMPSPERRMGRFFRELREGRHIGLRQAAALAHARGLKGLTVNRLGALERGTVKSPKPDLLRQISKLYEVPYDSLAEYAARNRYGVDLPRHPSNGSLSNETSANGVSSKVPTAPASSSPEVLRAGERTVFSPEYFDTAIREISVAVAAVETISGQLRELHAHLSDRLTKLGLAYADLIGGQMAVGAPDAPRAHEGVRKNDRRPDGKSRRHRKAG